MAHNRYFIISSTDPNMQQIQAVIVGNDKQRCSIDESQTVVKLHDGDHNNYGFLSQYTEYSHDDILPIMNSEPWQPQEV